MVNDHGILYTIEGITAGILMITTAYLILSTTSIYTPGDTHISDMQMEQLGNDVLAVMDTPPSAIQNKSNLTIYIEAVNGAPAFQSEFLALATTKGNLEKWNWSDRIKFSSTVFFQDNDVIGSYPFAHSGDLTGSEHLVKVTRRVLITDATNLTSQHGMIDRPRSVLLEVLMWRD